MAKGNQAPRNKPRDMANINDSFDRIAKTVEDMADGTRELMPLVADSLDLTRKLVKLYKDAFNAGLAKK